MWKQNFYSFIFHRVKLVILLFQYYLDKYISEIVFTTTNVKYQQQCLVLEYVTKMIDGKRHYKYGYNNKLKLTYYR